ncbi:MAG TPA: hypothetical protein VGN83_01305 [Falsiroseomonas sp.]|nr:hypothetical protein [Falsiroseomonas sp.]
MIIGLAREAACCKRAAGARLVLYHHRATHVLAQRRRDKPRDHIGGAARRERHDQSDVARGPGVLRAGLPGCQCARCRQHRAAAGQMRHSWISSPDIAHDKGRDGRHLDHLAALEWPCLRCRCL